MALGVLDVLDAVARAQQELAKGSLALDHWPPPQIVAIEHEQVESACHRDVIVGATVQGVKIGTPSASGKRPRRRGWRRP